MRADDGPFLQQQLHQFQARRLTRIIDIFLVRHSEECDLAPFDRLPAIIERPDTLPTTKAGIAVLISPASSMKRVDIPNLCAIHVR